MKVLKWIIGVPVVLFVLFMVIAAIQGRNTPISHLIYQDSVKSLLKDPSSADFTSVKRYDNGSVCGLVNAKNSYGGFVGARGFLVGPSGNAFLEDSTSVGRELFRRMQLQFCHDGPVTDEAPPEPTKPTKPEPKVKAKPAPKLRPGIDYVPTD